MAPEMGLPSPDQAFALGSTVAAATWAAFRMGVRYSAEHTGVPAVVVASVALVVSWRVFKRTVRFAVELAIALTVVITLTELGWLRF
jgi:phosphate/sulfate permease